MTEIEVGDVVKIVDVGDNDKYYSVGDIGEVIRVAKDETILIDFTYRDNISDECKEVWWAGIHDVEIVAKAAK